MDELNKKLERHTVFEDTVIGLAEKKASAIIGEAEKKRSDELRAVRASYDTKDYGNVLHKNKRGQESRLASAAYTSRRTLLQHRMELVQQMFDEVEQKVKEFTAQPAYGQWLQHYAVKHAAMAKENEPLTVYLRPVDMDAHSESLASLLGGAQVKPNSKIKLGGLQITNGHILQNETLDEKFEQEKQRFMLQSNLRV